MEVATKARQEPFLKARL